MSAMPVVWCTNPNSSEKPTAFALQGIQLQGNISDQHVLAVQELIAAASEGRLILPSDGTVVLLDCGVGVGSVVVGNNSSQNQQSTSSAVLCDTLVNTNNLKTSNNLVIHHKAEVHTIREESESEGISNEKSNDVSITKNTKKIKGRNENCDKCEKFERETSQLYEFLCCAKCMSEGVSRCFSNGRKRSVNNEKLIAKYLDKTRRHSVSSSSAVTRDELSLLKARGIRKNSFKYMRVGTPSSIATTTATGRQSPYRKFSLPVEMTKNDNKTSHTLISIDESTSPVQAVQQQQETTTSSTTCRKTSLDSICTVSSLDSGFNEMQNKLSSASLLSEGENHLNINNNKNIEIIVSEPTIAESDVNTGADSTEIVAADQDNNKEVLGCSENNSKLIICSNSNSTTTQQSRNRRKSYEEFKSMFRQNNERPLLIDTCAGAARTTSVPNKLEIVSEVASNAAQATTKTDKQPPTISRRKSYEEFKALVKICDNDLHSASIVPNNTQNDYKSVANSVYNNNTTVYDMHLSSMEDVTPETTLYNGMKRKSSKRHSLSKKDRLINIFLNNKITTETPNKTNCDKIYDIIQKRPQKTENGKNQNNDRLDKYRSKNFKLYDKLISYGTIYDIIQKKAEIYDTDFKQFEKYMTYGTIYEILRHKSDTEFPRRRVFSEKIYRQLRNNLLLDNMGHRYSTIHESMPGQRISNALIHKDLGDSTSTTSEVWNNTNTLSTIYDILQTSKNRNLTEDTDYEKSNKNRFMVKKVSEDDLNEKIASEEKTDSQTPKAKNAVKDESQKKQTRLRRFSNILSYKRDKSPSLSPTHKISTVSTPDLHEIAKKSSLETSRGLETLSIKNTNQLLNFPILNFPETSGTQKTDELYSRINKLNLNGNSLKNHKSTNGTNSGKNNKNTNDKENRIFKSSSSNDISQGARDDIIISNSKSKSHKNSNNELIVPARSDRKISANAKIISDKSKLCEQFVNDRRIYGSSGEKTRRLSEFTRGEFLNEKS